MPWLLQCYKPYNMNVNHSCLAIPMEYPVMKQLLRMMRITLLLMFLSLMQVSARSFGQITIHATNTPLNTVLDQIRTQTGYVFLTSDIELGQYHVNAELVNADIQTAMKALLWAHPLQYKIIDRTVVIKVKSNATATAKTLEDKITVNGRIVDDKGNPLQGASVAVTESKTKFRKATMTNDDGEFLLTNVPSNGILFITYLGYSPLSINLANAKMPLEIKLNPQSKTLEDVSVTYKTGYQQLSKDRATGSFVQIGQELLERTPSTNILDRIAYVTSGLYFDRKPSAPTTAMGERQTPFLIRGLSTINGNPHPLIVIDGFPYEETTMGGSNFYLTLNDLNPNDVAEVTILRDAAAASIWGAKAGNGVVVITTKKGRFNQPVSVNFTSNISVKEKENFDNMSVMSSADAVEAQTIIFNRGTYNPYDDSSPTTRSFPVLPEVAEILLQTRKGNITQAEANALLAKLAATDMRDDVKRYLMQNALTQQYAFNLSGGSDKFSYYTSVGYDREKGTAIGNESSRLTVRSDNTYKATKNLTINAHINYTEAENRNNGFDYMGLLNNSPLYTRIVDENGNPLAVAYKFRKTYADTASNPALRDWHYYPLTEQVNKDFRGKTMDVRTGVGVQYTLPAGFRFDANYQYHRITHETKNINGENSFYSRDFVNRFMGRTGTIVTYPIQRGAIVNYNNNAENFWQARAQLNFNRNFGKHEISSLAGVEMSQKNIDGLSDNLYGYNVETGLFQTYINYETIFPTQPTGGGEQIPNGNNVSGSLRRQRNYFANASYTYNNRYTFSLSGRQDGANIYGVKANQQLSPFWSTGLLWNIAGESFYKSALLPELKLRATYGFNGNYKNASAFGTINFSNNASTGLTAAQLTQYPNPYMRWEKTRVLNLGLDFAFRNNRISGSLEAYQKDGIDLVGAVANDPTTGVANYSGNQATIRGRGLDLSLNTRNLTGAIKWNTNFQVSYNNNKVTAFEGKYIAGQLLGGGQPVIGRSLWGLYSYRWGGLDATGRPQGYLNDVITPINTVMGYTGSTPNTKPEDLVYHGTSTPLYSGNMMNTVNWKSLSFSFNITFSFNYYFRRNSVNYNSLLPSNSSTYSGSITHKDFAQRWKKAGDEAFTQIPAMPTGSDFNLASFYANSSILVEKGDHIRLRDFRLGYDLSKTRGLGFMKKSNLFFTVNNLGILWKANKLGLDPDYFATEIPAAKTYVFGLQIQF